VHPRLRTRGPRGYAIVDLADEARAYEEQVFPDRAISDVARIARLDARARTDPDRERRDAWTAFRRRVLEPLRRFLNDPRTC